MEELVAKRVAEELERRKDEIEAEVMRRVEEAKKVEQIQIFLLSLSFRASTYIKFLLF